MSTGSALVNVSSITRLPSVRGASSVDSSLLEGGCRPAARNRPNTWTLDQASFDELLYWLDPDREVAGYRYELIRHRLITMFRHKGCSISEELADQTLDRVASKLPKIRPDYYGNPASYFWGVAKNVFREYVRSHSQKRHCTLPASNEGEEDAAGRLQLALDKLEPNDKDLILEYYRGDGRSKIINRQVLAGKLGLSIEALRARAYRIRAQLTAYLNTLEHHGVPLQESSGGTREKHCTRSSRKQRSNDGRQFSRQVNTTDRN